MAIKPTYASVELSSGEVFTDVRVTYADRVRYESTSKARGWRSEEKPATAAGFLAWAALKRLGLIDLSYDAYAAQLVDVALDDTAPAEDGTPDPTQTAL